MRRLCLIAVSLAAWLPGCHDPDSRLPSAYRTVPVPERVAASSAEAVTAGRELYLSSCALCHGERADGRGVRQNSLSTKPMDFTQKSWCRERTPRQVFHVIREGVDGTAMPAWKALGEGECWDLVAYLLSVCESS